MESSVLLILILVTFAHINAELENNNLSHRFVERVRPRKGPEECKRHVEVGYCVKFVKRWAFVKDHCYEFFYSGCGGNGNNFPSFNICMEHCENYFKKKNKKKEHLDSDSGVGNGHEKEQLKATKDRNSMALVPKLGALFPFLAHYLGSNEKLLSIKQGKYRLQHSRDPEVNTTDVGERRMHDKVFDEYPLPFAKMIPHHILFPTPISLIHNSPVHTKFLPRFENPPKQSILKNLIDPNSINGTKNNGNTSEARYNRYRIHRGPWFAKGAGKPQKRYPRNDNPKRRPNFAILWSSQEQHIPEIDHENYYILRKLVVSKGKWFHQPDIPKRLNLRYPTILYKPISLRNKVNFSGIPKTIMTAIEHPIFMRDSYKAKPFRFKKRNFDKDVLRLRMKSGTRRGNDTKLSKFQSNRILTSKDHPEFITWAPYLRNSNKKSQKNTDNSYSPFRMTISRGKWQPKRQALVHFTADEPTKKPVHAKGMIYSSPVGLLLREIMSGKNISRMNIHRGPWQIHALNESHVRLYRHPSHVYGLAFFFKTYNKL